MITNWQSKCEATNGTSKVRESEGGSRVRGGAREAFTHIMEHSHEHDFGIYLEDLI
jgi:hypothetical protein